RYLLPTSITETTTDESTALQLTTEENLWFTDTTLVLRAENRLFRRTPTWDLGSKIARLADSCTICCRFLSLRMVKPSMGAHLYDLSLKAIFHYDFFEPWPSTLEFRVVAGILRLSQKYQVDPLWKRALIHLSERCATSLEKAEELDD
ncbi:hypothetical protein C8R46DRAFT_468554, partial [Mycena filopes]